MSDINDGLFMIIGNSSKRIPAVHFNRFTQGCSEAFEQCFPASLLTVYTGNLFYPSDPPGTILLDNRGILIHRINFAVNNTATAMIITGSSLPGQLAGLQNGGGIPHDPVPLYGRTVMHFDGFIELQRPEGTAIVREDAAAVIADALLRDAGCETVWPGGRGKMQVFSFPGGRGVVRYYLRGGVMKKLFHDRYLQKRPLAEFRVHYALQRAGLSVPELLGAAWTRSGLFYRGAIATRQVEGTDLGRLQQEQAEIPAERLRDCGRLIRQMHDFGVWHADLQVRNLLAGEDRCWIIDFDNARQMKSLSPLQCRRNLLRLLRSIEKNGFDMAIFNHICEGYGETDFPGWLSRLYRLKGRVSDAVRKEDRP
jgi:3-deoxy-D-manno-octulosonic acid kinase